MTNELLIVAICAAVVCLFLKLRSFIVRGSPKPDSYQVWIMTLGDGDPGNDPSDLDEWPSEIEVPTDFLINAQAEAACEHILLQPADLTDLPIRADSFQTHSLDTAY